jgi:hypothetical protein
MKRKHFVSNLSPLWGAACVSLLLGFKVSGQYVVADGQNLTFDNPPYASINVHDFDTGGSSDVIIQSGGSITANTRVNMDGQITSPPNACQLILDGGSFTQANDSAGIKFADNAGPVEIRINSGTLSAVNIEHTGWRIDRPALILVGNGQLILSSGYLGGNPSFDPALWVNFPNRVVGGVAYANGLKALAGYELSFQDLGGGAVIISGVASTNCPAITVSTSPPLLPGETNSIFVSLTPGLNATQATTVDLASANTNVAALQGAVNGVLTLTFPAGGHYVTNILFNAVATGSSVFYLTNATAATCVTTTESVVKVGVRSSLLVARDANIQGTLNERDTNYGNDNQVRVSQSAGTQGGRKGYFLFDATGLPEILRVDDFQVQRAGGTTSRSIQLYAILGTNEFLGSVNNWTETGITWNNAPANNTNTVNVDTNRAFVTYPPGETLMFVEDLSTGSSSDTVYNVPVWRDMSEANRQIILNALNTGERKLTLGLQYNSSQATIIGFRSREYGVESSIPRINVLFSAAPTVAPVVIKSGNVNQAGNVVLTGEGGTTWGTYRVLSSPNVAEPLVNWIPVATNQFSNATFSVSIPFDPAVPQSFFVLQVQTP